ncbi:carbohydrate ABC transporter permease [Embleya sp. NPDC008237]|uniref:carbohydrate ABC transporter permease n=1 Tax=Embleya sp. NPDC008237 TaxID=3363978 RepID=UPI0036E5BAEA
MTTTAPGPAGTASAGAGPAAPRRLPGLRRAGKAGRTRKTKRIDGPQQRGMMRTALLFLLPLLAFYLVFYVFGFVFLARTSLQRTDLSFVDPESVGLENYRLLFTDDRFIRALLNNVVFAAAAVAGALTLGFFLAVVLSTGMRGRKVFYAVFLVPSLMPVALVASVFGGMMENRYGTLNETLRSAHLDFLAGHWLTEPGLAYAVVIGIFVYLVGLPIMYYTADLSALNTSLLEAAVLDGASFWQLLRTMLFPLMRTTHKTVVVSILLMSFRAFEIVFFSTKGGPAGGTEISGTYVYNYATSPGPRVGYASAAAVVVLLLALLLSAIQLRFTGKSEE